ncbi:hypothetical protein [Alsobacter sp. SYSU BS001988]
MSAALLSTPVRNRSTRVRKSIAAALVALTVGGAAIATSTPAAAGGWGYYHHRGWGYGGGAAAAGIVGGLALGAALAASAQPAYGAPVYAGDCYVVRRRVMTDYGWRTVRRTVCD